MGSPNENRVISTGSSDYGLAPPAVNSAISLMHVTLFYFGLLRQMDSRAMIRTIQKWLDILIDCYTSINSRSFSLEEIFDNLPQTYEWDHPVKILSRSTSDGWTASQFNSFERGAIMNIRKNIDYTQLYVAIDSAMEAAEKSRWNSIVKSGRL